MAQKDEFQELFEKLKNIEKKPEENPVEKQDFHSVPDRDEEFSMENVFKDADIGPDPYHVEPKQHETENTSPFVDNAPIFQDDQEPDEEEDLRVHVPEEKKSRIPAHKKLFQDKEATRQISLDEMEKVQAKSNTKKKKKSAKKSKKKLRNGIIYTVFVVGFSIVLSIVMIYAIYDIFGFNKEEGQVVVSVERDTSISKLSKLLKENGIIKQPGIFQLYAGLKDVEPYNAGEYTLNKNMSYDQIIYSMQSQSKEYNTVMVTITEGQSLVEISKILEENGVCSASEFIDALQTRSFGFDFEDQIPTDTGIYFPYEGYLFPDTYEFFLDENVDSVIKKFFVNFDSKITDEMKERMDELGMTLHETLTLASIIQKEAGSNEEMKRVSSVFHNRLNNPAAFPTLQSDVTIFYVNDYIKPYSDSQELYDSYNTYRCHGLPIGPITNPGLDAINAALYPEDTPYYFFVTDSDGKYYYAETLAEHEANCAEAEKVGGVHGTQTTE